MTIEQPNDFLDSVDLLYSMEELDQALTVMAQKINQDFANQSLLVMGVMNGAVVTMGQLLPKIRSLLDVDYCHATRYGQQTTGGDIEWLAYPQKRLQGKNILLVDDIFDEGVTLKHIASYCKAQGAAQVISAVLLDKQHNRKVEGFCVDYAALSIEDRYVFGFGLDYQGRYRNAPGIYAIPDHLL